MIKFYDTCALLDLQEKAFQSETKFLISNITLQELENIKTSGTKDEEVKYAARQLLHLLNKYQDKYEVIIYKENYNKELTRLFLPISNDSQIIISALIAFKERKILQDSLFITKDLACKILAQSIGLKTEYISSNIQNEYTGYKKISMDEEELAHFYNIILSTNQNIFNLLNNEYLLISFNNEITDKYKWVNNHYEKIPFQKIQSNMFGKIVPKDDYQSLVIDSFNTNQITVIRGKPGSGKSFLALNYLISLLEKNKINTIIIFTNTVAVRGSAKLGFYPGSKDEKLLDSQIGNFLSAKFGSIIEVEKMIDEGTLILLPVADCRGVDLTGKKAGILVTEAQNTSVDMMKLILQRIGEDSICIIEGDDKSQVDMQYYSGNNNGLQRLSQVFRGEEIYGEVTLNIIHRSKIAEIADKM